LNGIPTGGLNPNSTPSTADGAMIAVPATANLVKTSVTCTAINGAQCPATVTVAQLESGLIIPSLPDRGAVTFAFSGTVTGPAGGSVLVRSVVAPPVGHVTPDTGFLTKTLTQSILPANGGTSTGTAAAAPSTGTQQPVSGQAGFVGGGAPATVADLTKVCAMPAPHVSVAATPGGVYLSWSPLQDPAVAPAGPTYTVSRVDLGLLTPTPIVNPPSNSVVRTPRFTHNVLLSYLAPATYTYTVEAKYVQGCGSTSVTVQTPRPWTPALFIRQCVPNPQAANRYLVTCDRHTFSPERTQLLTTTRPTLTEWLSLILEWSVPPEVLPYGGDNVGWLVHGPGLSVNGVYLNHHCGLPQVVEIGGCNPQVNPYPGGTLELPALGPEVFPEKADYVWTVTPVWDIPGGRFFDLASAARVVVRVQ
jgi:hypothetical protein